MLAVIAQAQPQAPPTPPPEREGSAEFAYVGTSGNSRTQSIGAGGQVIYRPAPWEIQLKVSYVRNEAEAQLKAQSLTFNARGQRQLRPRLAAYGQYGYLRDRFAGVLDRNAVEAGLAYSLIDSAPHKLTADAGLAYANERRLVGNNLSTAAVGAGGAYVLKISSTSDFSEDGHFTFSLSEGADWRFTNAAAVTAKMTTVFSLKLSNTIRYVNLPVLGFDRTDTVTAIALVAKF
jgi:putative salt-induced outer membrane protein